jgi:hypothetical protein
LSPIAAIAPGFGPMKTMPASASARGERLALGQEAVAGMHRLGAGLAAGLDDLVDAQIALGRGGGPISTASSAISTCSASRSASE